jgi:hypothetical protein
MNGFTAHGWPRRLVLQQHDRLPRGLERVARVLGGVHEVDA